MKHHNTLVDMRHNSTFPPLSQLPDNDNRMSNERIYRAAVALNNIGVSLLAVDCYSQALVTMLDAFTVIKVACSDGEQARPSEAPLQKASPAPASMAEVDAKLRRANERLSHRQGSNQLTQRAAQVLAVSDDPTVAELEAVFRHSHEPRKGGQVYGIHLESASLDLLTGASGTMESDVFQEEATFLCKVVLHNLGLAYLCLSQSCGDERAFAFSQKGVTLLHLCDQVLVNLSEQTSRKVHTFRRVLFLGMVSTISYRHFAGAHPALEQRIESIREGILRINSTCPDCGLFRRSASCAPAA